MNFVRCPRRLTRLVLFFIKAITKEKIMKVAKGENITVEGNEATVTKVSAAGKGVLNINKKVGDQTAITPMVRIYFTYPDGKKDYRDATLPDDVEVVLG
jgi:hypothetical protein